MNFFGIEYWSMVSILPPCGMAIFYWFQLKIPYRILAVFVFFTLIMELLGFTLFHLGINNLILFHFFTWIEGLLLGTYFIFVFKSTRLQLFTGLLILMFLGFSVYCVTCKESFDHYNSTQRSIGSFWAIILCIIFYIQLFYKSNVKQLLTYPHYWMTSAFLLYFAGMLFTNLVGDLVLTTDSADKITYNPFIIHAFLNIFLNIMFTIVLWLAGRLRNLERS